MNVKLEADTQIAFKSAFHNQDSIFGCLHSEGWTEINIHSKENATEQHWHKIEEDKQTAREN